ncbi:hypothetical protein BCR35DRAFT_348913 [Leucosporidium creatinivorum]|uniref:Uncharacterized protein n=1 Tax=Leucosporidium creatinivorum TaxID=106004 RepID=A0A1Y2G594_9BASI|nr:hypothetical protein BCR35DRAFT_348913 [Leucosporidium creatinivorum]
MRSTLVALAGFAAIASASVHQPSSAHKLAARNVDVSVHKNDPRTLCLIENLLGGLFGGGSSCGGTYPSASWTCSGSGLDGFDYDANKKKCPSNYPSGWKYFGKDLGWGPPKSWSPPSNSWSAPSAFLNSCSKFTWWAPSKTWVYPTSVSLPFDLWLGLGWSSYKGPSTSWSCSKSGKDGYDYDFKGQGCPYSGVTGWKYFGVGFGWLPPVGWVVPSNNWTPPSDFASSCSAATWWSPSSSWNCPSTISPPTWWPKPTTTTTVKPSTTTTVKTTTTTKASTTSAAPSPSVSVPPRGWTCDGTGNDGWTVDYDGNTLPYPDDGYLTNSNGQWLFFGDGHGWLPSEPWNIPYDTWTVPEGFSNYDVNLATWWVPASSWHYPAEWTVPSFWIELDPTWTSYLATSSSAAPSKTTTSSAPSLTVSVPPRGWTCDGTGNDGWTVDYDGNTLPYPDDGYLTNSNGQWLFFGDGHGWLPSEPWNIPYDTWTVPEGFSNYDVNLATWWVPASSWHYPAEWTVPSFWIELDPTWTSYLATSSSAAPSKTTTSAQPSSTGNPWPGQDWDCDGSGNDGWDFDPSGNKCPYSGLPFKWFGKSHGWQPIKGWWGVSSTFSFPSAWLNTCNKATWWAPSSQWQYPSGFSWPSHWISLGWSGYNWAPSSFVCNGKGNDGYSFDHVGNGRPSGYPDGFFYFGIGPQWQPQNGWGLPSSKWTPPSGWSPRYATWWQPNIKWSLPNGYSCPQWWPTSLLSGIFSWIF